MMDSTEIIEVSDEVLAICAITAARRTDGVKRMEGGLQNTLRKNILGKELLAKGVKVNRNDKYVEINTHVIIKYGFHIPTVAWDIQENVKKEIADITGVQVTSVNINVEGVETDDKK